MLMFVVQLQKKTQHWRIIFKILKWSVNLDTFNRGRTICIIYTLTLKINTFMLYTNKYSDITLVIKLLHVPSVFS